MNVLWVTNTIFPDLALKLDQKKPVVGGWMYGLAKDLVKKGVKLTVATARVKAINFNTEINGIKYYLLESFKNISEYDSSLEYQWNQVLEDTKPDLVHIHGTEYAIGLALMRNAPNLTYIISIQGLISVYARYYTGHISEVKIKKHKTIRDFLKNNGILSAQKSFYKRGELVEKEYFKICQHFIGRTQWDLEHTLTLNRKATYHFCNESLRDAFYIAPKWQIDQINKHSVFLSQAIYPLKGLHQVLKAVSLLKNEFPTILIRVAGDNIIAGDTLKERMAIGGYAHYIRSLIRLFNLDNNIEFTGQLSEELMIQEYLKCHVFVCPSSIENSPNSLGEAQLLGAPCIASYAGGIPDMVKHGESGLLYRFEEHEMLAQAIKKVFEHPDLAMKLSSGGIKAGSERHDRQRNSERTLEIYKCITTSKTKD